jgi:hypothetical protein
MSIDQFTASALCGSINPSFIYKGYDVATGNLLSPLTDFISVDSQTGSIKTLSTKAMAINEIKIVGELTNKYQTSSQFFTLKKIVPSIN